MYACFLFCVSSLAYGFWFQESKARFIILWCEQQTTEHMYLRMTVQNRQWKKNNTWVCHAHHFQFWTSGSNWKEPCSLGVRCMAHRAKALAWKTKCRINDLKSRIVCKQNINCHSRNSMNTICHVFWCRIMCRKTFCRLSLQVWLWLADWGQCIMGSNFGYTTAKIIDFDDL